MEEVGYACSVSLDLRTGLMPSVAVSGHGRGAGRRSVMAMWWWSVPLAGLGLVGQYLAGRRAAAAWVVGLVDEGLWLAYAVRTGQWLFGVSAVVYSWVYVRNLRSWREDRGGLGQVAWLPGWRREPAGPRRRARLTAAAMVAPGVLALAGCSLRPVTSRPAAVWESSSVGQGQGDVRPGVGPAVAGPAAQGAVTASAASVGATVIAMVSAPVAGAVTARRRVVWRGRRWVAGEVGSTR